MNRIRCVRVLFGEGAARFRSSLAVFGAVLILLIAPVTRTWQGARLDPTQTGAIPPSTFARIIADFSEAGGFFHSDNFTSNETSYLHVLDKLRQLGASGGAYIGVGPEQNFTYIARIRPRIAFIVDIRRQAMIQHLMYKAIFHLSEDRAQFLSRLLSRPPRPEPRRGLAGEGAPGGDSSLDALLNYFSEAPATEEAFATNLATIRETIERRFRFPLSPVDQKSLEYVYGAFREGNLSIAFRIGRGSFWGSPTLKELLLQTDLQGKRGSFLVNEKDYAFLRDLHRANRIIPVVGDFAGPKALAAVAGYLRKNGYTVTAFYTSNVEQFLFSSGVFRAFAENVRELPITEESLFIRSFRNRWEPHPARVPGHRTTTILQKIAVFLRDYDQALYPDHRNLITTHFITANER